MVLGAMRLDGTLCLRRSGSSRGAGCYRPAFEPLSHGPRSFHHKNRPTPQSLFRLENFRAATEFPTANASPYSSALTSLLRLRFVPTSRNGYRFYSRSSTLPNMAEVKWTGPLVRKTFLDFFAERGHAIGRSPSAPPPRFTRFRSPPWQFVQKNRIPLELLSSKTTPCALAWLYLDLADLAVLPRSALVVGRPSQ